MKNDGLNGTLYMRRRKKRTDGFKSKFEADIAKHLDERGITWEYEKCKLKYTVPEKAHSYTPDWQLGEDKTILWESKGRFTLVDRSKMSHVLMSNPDVQIRMVFQKASVPIAKGSKTTYGDWCTKNGIDWCEFGDKQWKEWTK